MLCLSVFESDDKIYRALRERLIAYHIRLNADMDIMRFSDTDSRDKLIRYAERIHIAFIRADDVNAKTIGKALRRENAACRIVFYGIGQRIMNDFLSAMPSAYIDLQKDDLDKHIDTLRREALSSKAFLHFESRREIMLYPFDSILYLQSNLKQVELHMKNGSVHLLTAKLSDIESRLGISFLRLHKSFIVNTDYAVRLDKSRKQVEILGGILLPISDANYDNVLTRLRELKNMDTKTLSEE